MEQYSNRKYSLFDFDNLTTKDNMKYELIDGIVLMSPRPSYRHQEVMGNLFLCFGNYLKDGNCRVFTEAELEFKDDVLIPDLSVICGLENYNFQRYKNAPEIVIEIISPGSQYTDTFTKLFKYELMGVKEYWIVNPKTEIITIYNFVQQINFDFEKQDTLSSTVFSDFTINLSDIF